MPVTNIGAAPNDGTGDTLRAGMAKVNDAFQSITNEVIPPNTVTELLISDGAVTEPKLAAGAVVEGKLGDQAVASATLPVQSI